MSDSNSKDTSDEALDAQRIIIMESPSMLWSSLNKLLLAIDKKDGFDHDEISCSLNKWLCLLQNTNNLAPHYFKDRQKAVHDMTVDHQKYKRYHKYLKSVLKDVETCDQPDGLCGQTLERLDILLALLDRADNVLVWQST